MSELSVLERATLQALANVCGYSLTGHASKEDVSRKFAGHLRGNVKKALETLRKKQYCTHVGGKRSTRYRLSKDGLSLANINLGLPL